MRVVLSRLAPQLPVQSSGMPKLDPAAMSDAEVSLPRLAARHWQRYRRCPHAQRPASFTRYLLCYYRHAWQSDGWLDLLSTALQRTRGRFARVT